MSEENNKGFFSRIGSGIGNMFRTIWHGIKYVGLGLTQIAGGVVGVGPGVGSGVSKIVGGTRTVYNNVLTDGFESAMGNGSVIGWSLSDLLAQKRLLKSDQSAIKILPIRSILFKMPCKIGICFRCYVLWIPV